MCKRARGQRRDLSTGHCVRCRRGSARRGKEWRRCTERLLVKLEGINLRISVYLVLKIVVVARTPSATLYDFNGTGLWCQTGCEFPVTLPQCWVFFAFVMGLGGGVRRDATFSSPSSRTV